MLRGAMVYFALVFLCGTVFGTVRTLVLTPALGPLGAVLVELPFMIGVSWLACRMVMRVFHVSGDRRVRAMTGLVAFVLLMGAEFLLFSTLAEDGPAHFLTAMMRPEGLAGLAGQVLFGLFPLLQASSAEPPSGAHG